jgi:hypothetical protein
VRQQQQQQQQLCASFIISFHHPAEILFWPFGGGKREFKFNFGFIHFFPLKTSCLCLHEDGPGVSEKNEKIPQPPPPLYLLASIVLYVAYALNATPPAAAPIAADSLS